MPANDRELFDQLRADVETPAEIDFLTYAIFANEKSEWIRLFEKRNGQPPGQNDIDEWIANLTDWRLAQMRQEAVQFFDGAARRYLEDEIAEAQQEVLRSALVREVRAAGSFWRQLAMALATAILAPIIIGGIIAFALTYDRVNPTFGSISGRLQSPGSPTPERPQENK